jgi:hypothetical protein
MLLRVALVGTEVSEEYRASVIRVISGELGTTLAVFLLSVLRLLVTANVVPGSSILVTLMMEAIRSSANSLADYGPRSLFF